MLCYHVSQVWIHYEVSDFLTGLSMPYILLYFTKVQIVISTQRTKLALWKEMYAPLSIFFIMFIFEKLRVLSVNTLDTSRGFSNKGNLSFAAADSWPHAPDSLLQRATKEFVCGKGFT